MHQTTVRFGPDLWEALEAECSRLGCSAAQYVREAALARLAFTAGRSAAPEYEAALAFAVADQSPVPGASPRLESASVELAPQPETVPAVPAPFGLGGMRGSLRARAAETVERSVAEGSSARALEAESDLILRRAREIRAKSRELRASTREEHR